MYLSNESEYIDVFFDNLVVQHYTGPLVEENHYYPFGLKIASISSHAALRPAIPYGYQGVHNEEDAATGYNEFALRSYDPQIGRWIQSDPYEVEPGMYNGMGNDPVNMVDPLGGFSLNPLGALDWIRNKITKKIAWSNTVTKEDQSTMPEGYEYFSKADEIYEAVDGRIILLEEGTFKVLMKRTTPDVSYEDQLRFYVNLTGDVETGFKYGAVKNIWDMAKGLFQTAWNVNSGPSLEKMQYSYNFVMGIKAMGDDAVQNYNGNLGLAMAGNYLGDKWNAITKGDLFDASTASGAVTTDAFLMIAPELRLGKAGLVADVTNGVKGAGNGFRYITEAEFPAVKNTGLLRGGRAGETYFTKDVYKSAASAQNRLALPTTPTIRIEFQILNNPTMLRNGTKVLPANGMMGKGADFMTLDPVKVKLINWQPLR